MTQRGPEPWRARVCLLWAQGKRTGLSRLGLYLGFPAYEINLNKTHLDMIHGEKHTQIP